MLHWADHIAHVHTSHVDAELWRYGRATAMDIGIVHLEVHPKRKGYGRAFLQDLRRTCPGVFLTAHGVSESSEGFWREMLAQGYVDRLLGDGGEDY